MNCGGKEKIVKLMCLVGGGDLERRIIFSSDPHFWEVLFSPKIGRKMGEKVGLDEKLSI